MYGDSCSSSPSAVKKCRIVLNVASPTPIVPILRERAQQAEDARSLTRDTEQLLTQVLARVGGGEGDAAGGESVDIRCHAGSRPRRSVPQITAEFHLHSLAVR